MPRISKKQNKNVYQRLREEAKLTREAASVLLETVSPERIERIESEKAEPYPDEVLLMSKKYKAPSLCNYYCSNQCPIGQYYVPEIKLKDLSQIILEMLSSLNSMNKCKDRLIDITADGKIDEDELSCVILSVPRFPQVWVATQKRPPSAVKYSIRASRSPSPPPSTSPIERRDECISTTESRGAFIFSSCLII